MNERLNKYFLPDIKDEDLNRQAFFLNASLLATLGIAVAGIAHVLVQLGQRAPSSLISISLFVAALFAIVALCYTLVRKGRVHQGSLFLVAALTAASIGTLVVGGTRGAVPAMLVIPVATAALTLGPKASLRVAGICFLSYLVIAFLDSRFLLHVYYASPRATILANIFYAGFALFFVTLSVWLSGTGFRQAMEHSQAALTQTEGMRLELEKTLAASQAYQASLQQAISQYAGYLLEVSHGNYQARLEPSTVDESLEALGEYIQRTVDSMAKAVAQSEAARNELDAAQRRYLLQSWQYYLRNRPSTDFEVGQANGGSLRPALQRSVVERRTKVDAPQKSPEGEASLSQAVAVPIVLRGQVLGALGFQTEGAERVWTPEEQAMVEAIAERLGMALENLRLLEETQNRAARETLIRQVTAHMRETLDMDTVLRTTADDVFKILDLDEVVIRLSQDGGNGSVAA